jgi:hypothetical protein
MTHLQTSARSIKFSPPSYEAQISSLDPHYLEAISQLSRSFVRSQPAYAGVINRHSTHCQLWYIILLLERYLFVYLQLVFTTGVVYIVVVEDFRVPGGEGG